MSKQRNIKTILHLFIGSIIISSCVTKAGKKTAVFKEKPNIIVILADDMGYSDLGCYGGEIETPNLDALAYGGIRFTNFYNMARCCPTRAALLTGLLPHDAGMGAMVRHTDQKERPKGSFQGFLGEKSVTIAEVLKDEGYYTSMSGKWHVGEEKKHWPMNRGFNDYYGLISGAANYFDITKQAKKGRERHFANGMEEHIPKDKDFYMTNAITNHAVKTIENRKGEKSPFFMYVAYTAPHWPLHALPEDIKKYQGHYDIGWDSIKSQRYKRMKQLGIVNQSMNLAERDPNVPLWEGMDKKDLLARKMEVYAAQIDRMDQGIGEIMKTLKEIGEFENTLILFLSDNGACAETGIYGTDWWENGVMPGGPDSYQSYGRGWANASNTPFKYYKQWVYEGGISTPLIAHWPDKIKDKGRISRQQGVITDIMATAIDVANTKYPVTYKERTIKPLHGKSLLPVFEGKQRDKHEVLYWEHFGNMAITRGAWKLVSRRKEGQGKWALYNLDKDRAENQNLIEKEPELGTELLKEYKVWAKKTGINKKINNEFSNENL